MKRLKNKRDRANEKARRSGKAVHLLRYDMSHVEHTKRLYVTHGKCLNEVMGGLTPESLEIGPVNAGFNGIKLALLYVKLLQGVPKVRSSTL